MKLSVNGQTLTVTLVDNEATRELIRRLEQGPVTLSTRDYGGWEKVGDLGFSLPISDEHIDMKPGDIVLYQGHQLVIMYGENSWSETRIGHIDGYTGQELHKIFGEGNATFTLSN